MKMQVFEGATGPTEWYFQLWTYNKGS